ncbi:AAA family ATPase [Myxococcota bacterium]|nr:AAA family ATPase [Myxococcota bacterium]
MDIRDSRVTAGRLRARDPDRGLDFETTAGLGGREASARVALECQPRAVAAFRAALADRDPGFNVYCLGSDGLARADIVLAVLREEAARRPAPADIAYVHNFEDEDRPLALSLKAGEGRVLARRLDEIVERARDVLAVAFAGSEYQDRRRGAEEDARVRRAEILERLKAGVESRGFALQQLGPGIATVPARDGVPMGDDELSSLPEPERERMLRTQREVRDTVQARIRELDQLEKQVKSRVELLDREVARAAVVPLFEGLRARYARHRAVRRWLDAARDDMVEQLEHFRDEESDPSENSPHPGLVVRLGGEPEADPLLRYRVNVVVDHSGSRGAPVELEAHPTYPNLFGRIERRARLGALITDHTKIRAGALHRASGGFLVMFAEDLLRQAVSYDALKKALRGREVRIEELPAHLGLAAAETLSPEPSPLDVRVVLIGDAGTYALLHAADAGFRRLFKIRADFDDRMDADDGARRRYARFVAALCREEGLRPFSRAAVARIVEEGSRRAEDRHRLTAALEGIRDLACEAEREASLARVKVVGPEHVDAALEHARDREGLVEARLREMIVRGEILVSTRGEVVGQVNCLAVSNLGDTLIVQPSRVTAALGAGRRGIVDIERQAHLSGPIHSKGVLILSGYLEQRFGRELPLSIAATLCFEQTYGPVDGDSASAAELVALVSALSEVPITQQRAITGAVSQRGELQPVGAIPRKIEGFFDLCARAGLTGQQGVIVPRTALDHLVLRPDVVEAVRRRRFHVHAASHVDEALELLTGVPAVEVERRALARARELALSVRSVESGVTGDAFGSLLENEARATPGRATRPRTSGRRRRPEGEGGGAS